MHESVSWQNYSPFLQTAHRNLQKNVSRVHQSATDTSLIISLMPKYREPIVRKHCTLKQVRRSLSNEENQENSSPPMGDAGKARLKRVPELKYRLERYGITYYL